MSPENEHKTSLEYIPLCEASKKSGYTPEYLNSLARKGKLCAKKIGRNWYTTCEWLNEFLETTNDAKRKKIEKLDSKIREYANEDPEISKTEEKASVAEPRRSFYKIYKIPSEYTQFAFEQVEVKFRSRWRSLNFFATTLFVVFLLFGVFQVGKFLRLGHLQTREQLGEGFDNYTRDGEYPGWISEEGGIVKGEEDVYAEMKPSGATLASENFWIREIKFGGAIAMASALENVNLEIYDIRSETMATKGEEENKLLVRWRTSKPALSTIEYSILNGNNPKRLIEDGYGFGHSVVLSNLEPGTAYSYVITTKDKWANQISSDRYSAYTGKKTVSVFDLIVNAIREVFGWAVK